MKKTQLLVFAVFSFLFGGVLFAQQTTVSTSEPQVSDLGDVKVRFCNDPAEVGGTKTLTLQTKPLEENEICVYIQNTGPTPLKIGINFVDGTFTQGSGEPKKACNPETSKEVFGQYVNMPSSGFMLEPNQAITTKVQLKFPEGYAGVANGCLTTHIINDEESASAVKVLSRRANFIDAYVDGKVRIGLEYGAFSGGSTYKNISDTDLVTLYKRPDDKYAVRYMLINTGNLPVMTTGNFKLQLFWLFEKKWKNITSKVAASGFTYVDIEMPFYFDWIAGPIKFDLDNTYKADVDSHMPNYEQITSKEYALALQAHAFLIPWWTLVILIPIILIIIKRKLSKSKTSKHGNQNK